MKLGWQVGVGASYPKSGQQQILMIWTNVARTNAAWIEILIIWTNVARTNAAWTNVHLTMVLDCPE